jgi:hypothetical protein
MHQEELYGEISAFVEQLHKDVIICKAIDYLVSEKPKETVWEKKIELNDKVMRRLAFCALPQRINAWNG